ncbi:hypothetical protein D3C74_446620 [compost metagenome]
MAHPEALQFAQEADYPDLPCVPEGDLGEPPDQSVLRQELHKTSLVLVKEEIAGSDQLCRLLSISQA